MKSLTFIFLLVISVVGVFSQAPQAVSHTEVAHVLGALPEFRDLSAWKGRTGLTLFSPNGKYLAVALRRRTW